MLPIGTAPPRRAKNWSGTELYDVPSGLIGGTASGEML